MARQNAYQAAIDYSNTPEFQALLESIYAGIREKSVRGEGVAFFGFTRSCASKGRSPMLVANALQISLAAQGFKVEFQNIIKFKGLYKRYKLLLFWGANAPAPAQVLSPLITPKLETSDLS